MALQAKLKGGVLFTVLIISTVITTITATLIFVAYYYKLVTIRNKTKEELILNTSSAINYMLATKLPFPEKPIILDLYEQGSDSISVEVKPWGLWDITLARAWRGRFQEEKIALVGVMPDKYGNVALYLQDETRALSVSGRNAIIGDAYLPKAGVYTSYVNGTGFYNGRPVEGTIHTSNKGLPSLNQHYLSRVQKLCDLSYVFPGQFASPVPLLPTGNQVISNSYTEKPIVYHYKDSVHIDNAITGNIIVKSEKAISIGSNARLDGVIIMARSVYVQKGFLGKLQIFANEEVKIEGDCTLEYPSAICIYKNAYSKKLSIDDNSYVQGVIYMGGSSTRDTELGVITIAEQATVEGQLWLDAKVQHKGSILGSLACRKFFLITPTTLYENYLVNAEIDKQKRSPYFISTGLLSTSNDKDILEWLD
jgi:cytoskeletal protein CcmA (bactofilin family)